MGAKILEANALRGASLVELRPRKGHLFEQEA